MNSNLSEFLWLAPGAYLLGSLPFSVWLGRLFLKKDIRAYGDHNPGAANVFRAGNPVLGMAAVLLDVGKGVPFVVLAGWLDLSQTAAVTVGLAAILGHAFSPWLRFHGGKSVAVTFGVLIGLWHPAWLFPFCFAALIGLLLWESHAWIMLLAPAETIVFMLLTRAGFLPVIFMLCVQALFTYKYASDIDGPPRLRAALRERLMPRRQA
ncbi:MAG: glycerol-3-phosphate acyltransferase [Dehalococcoidia bacterium]|nr:MAG: glycerol-3-phosphate acyltransferase [Dehalococcoidia bacterium]